MSWQASGFRAWLWQRLSAVYIGVFLIWFFLSMLWSPPASFEIWRAWVGGPFVATALALFFFAVFVHSWVGVRDIIIDYVHVFALRMALLVAVGLFLLGLGFWVIRILVLASV